MTLQSTIEELRNRLADQGEVPRSRARRSSSLPRFDRLLGGGWRGGTVVEWLADAGAGATELAFHSLVTQLSPHQVWCVIDPDGTFFSLSALVRSSVSPCLVVRPRSDRELWWATEQILRCRGIAVTWCRIDSIPERVLRRWQLAVESGGGIGMLFRPVSTAGSRSWSDLRLAVTPVRNGSRFSRRLRVEVLSCRGRLGGQAVMLELHDAPDRVPLVSELDDSAVAAGRTRYTLRCAGGVG